MSIFISYSHADRDPVDVLAAALVKAKNHVWVDRWELRVGDSLIQRVQAALQDADALLVVLSKASVESEWCKKELSAGLVRELEERRVVVLPVLIENCEVPLFLRDKMYADFRSDREHGMRQVLEAVAGITSTTLGRSSGAGWTLDWSVDWHLDELVHVVITIVERVSEYPYTFLTEVEITGNSVVTRRYREYVAAGLEEFGGQVILESLTYPELRDLQVLLIDSRQVNKSAAVEDSKTGVSVKIEIRCRWLGEDMGRDVLLNVGNQVSRVVGNIRKRLRGLSAEETANLLRILRSPIE